MSANLLSYRSSLELEGGGGGGGGEEEENVLVLSRAGFIEGEVGECDGG